MSHLQVVGQIRNYLVVDTTGEIYLKIKVAHDALCGSECWSTVKQSVLDSLDSAKIVTCNYHNSENIRAGRKAYIVLDELMSPIM